MIIYGYIWLYVIIFDCIYIYTIYICYQVSFHMNIYIYLSLFGSPLFFSVFGTEMFLSPPSWLARCWKKIAEAQKWWPQISVLLAGHPKRLTWEIKGFFVNKFECDSCFSHWHLRWTQWQRKLESCKEGSNPVLKIPGIPQSTTSEPNGNHIQSHQVHPHLSLCHLFVPNNEASGLCVMKSHPTLVWWPGALGWPLNGWW